ncbi:PepSY domain-containing protein [Aureispira anguillae]|uniref:PepSY domain-containing protein n=1 Tax=Aureispira anguillae TaxID=2864201 RepID=A0A915YAW8_9BACT|nr:PepSY domain-containing protein [Aureispira anguillae]BDS09375.1 PepSY domain-containing protein [Aureispira anguillae]
MFNKLYKWHNRIGLLIVIPILGWCISGLTHPMMAHLFKIKPAERFLRSAPIQLDSTSISLAAALNKHKIASFQNFRMVNFEGTTYYQIIQTGKPSLYIHATKNTLLEDGDQRYATYLARYFLGDSISAIKSISVLDRFTFEYKFINRLLPVYKVSFDRGDKMDVYVETNSSRLGTLNNSTRKACIAIFSYLHNWSFLNDWPNAKLFLMLLFMGLSFFVAASGLIIYGFLWKSFQTSKGGQVDRSRKWHRRIGLMVSISTLAFAFSGAYHALAKKSYASTQTLKNNSFDATIVANLPQLWTRLDGRLVKNIALASFEGKTFYQVIWMDKATEVGYFEVQNLAPISRGEERYAIHLASKYSQLPADKILSTTPIQQFGGEYGFINKRLPVAKVQYDTEEQHSIYVETSSGKLAANISSAKRWEALSFLILHKYHFLDPMGKKVRDAVIVVLILGIMLVHILGLVLWLRRYNRG